MTAHGLIIEIDHSLQQRYYRSLMEEVAISEFKAKCLANAYPDLEGEDVHQALRYAAEAVREREPPVVGGVGY